MANGQKSKHSNVTATSPPLGSRGLPELVCLGGDAWRSRGACQCRHCAFSVAVVFAFFVYTTVLAVVPFPAAGGAKDHDDASPALSLTHAHGTAEATKMASSTSRELGATASFREVVCHVHKSGSRVMWSTIVRSCGRA